MAEQHSFGVSLLWLYSLFLAILYLSTPCNSENHVPYDVARLEGRPLAATVLVSHFVPHLRYRRHALTSDNGTDPSSSSNSGSDGGNAQNDPVAGDSQNGTSGTPTNSSSTQEENTSHNATNTAVPTTGNPFANATVVHDTNSYYEVASTFAEFDAYWIELVQATRHETLSKSHRVAAVIDLHFKFPFYGHLVESVTIATGGFIYMSPFLHQWLTATQYIAPLMANFDLSMSPQSNIYYLSRDDAFYVEWRNVILQDQNETGPFSFQAILKKSGEINFVYKEVPVKLADISKMKHPVKVGVSDAYYNDTYIPQLNVKRRTIYEYDKITVKEAAVRTGSVVFLKPLPTCNTLKDCKSCAEHEGVNFNCGWCSSVKRCSDGLDWHRQEWQKSGCSKSNTEDPATCPVPSTTSFPTTEAPTTQPAIETSVRVTTENVVYTTEGLVQSSESPKAPQTSPTTLQPNQEPPTTQPPPEQPPTTHPPPEQPQTTQYHPERPQTTQSPPEQPQTTQAPPEQPPATGLPPSTTSEGVQQPPDSGASRRESFCSSVNSSEVCDKLPPTNKCDNNKCGTGPRSRVAIIIVIILLICGLLAGICGWVFYAYTHPTSKSGMWLMEHRPSQIKAKIQFWKSSSDSGAAKYKMESEA